MKKINNNYLFFKKNSVTLLEKRFEKVIPVFLSAILSFHELCKS